MNNKFCTLLFFYIKIGFIIFLCTEKKKRSCHNVLLGKFFNLIFRDNNTTFILWYFNIKINGIK